MKSLHPHIRVAWTNHTPHIPRTRTSESPNLLIVTQKKLDLDLDLDQKKVRLDLDQKKVRFGLGEVLELV